MANIRMVRGEGGDDAGHMLRHYVEVEITLVDADGGILPRVIGFGADDGASRQGVLMIGSARGKCSVICSKSYYMDYSLIFLCC